LFTTERASHALPMMGIQVWFFGSETTSQQFICSSCCYYLVNFLKFRMHSVCHNQRGQRIQPFSNYKSKHWSASFLLLKCKTEALRLIWMRLSESLNPNFKCTHQQLSVRRSPAADFVATSVDVENRMLKS
jgi:hypothetical protein